jgi:hypothetical protein
MVTGRNDWQGASSTDARANFDGWSARDALPLKRPAQVSRGGPGRDICHGTKHAQRAGRHAREDRRDAERPRAASVDELAVPGVPLHQIRAGSHAFTPTPHDRGVKSGEYRHQRPTIMGCLGAGGAAKHIQGGLFSVHIFGPDRRQGYTLPRYPVGSSKRSWKVRTRIA